MTTIARMILHSQTIPHISVQLSKLRTPPPRKTVTPSTLPGPLTTNLGFVLWTAATQQHTRYV
jgi:hypothetical protein